MEKETIIKEFEALRAEIAVRIRIHHQLIALANIFWLVFLIFGAWIFTFGSAIFITYLLIIPLVFTGLLFNYQDNQRTMEVTAKYIEEKLKPKLERSLEWEKYFASQKKNYQFSSAYKIFAFLAPFVLPIILLINFSLTHFQTDLAFVDLVLLIIALINFRYKLYRVKS